MKERRFIIFCLFALVANFCQAQSSGSHHIMVENEFVNTRLMEREDSMQSLLLEEYAKSHGYKTPDYDVFKEKCLQLFGIRLHPSAQVYSLDINKDIIYSVNEFGRFIFTGNESLFYQPALDHEPTMSGLEKFFTRKKMV